MLGNIYESTFMLKHDGLIRQVCYKIKAFYFSRGADLTTRLIRFSKRALHITQYAI